MLEYAGFLHGVANKVAFGYEDRVKKNLFSRNIASTNTKKRIVRAFASGEVKLTFSKNR